MLSISFRMSSSLPKPAQLAILEHPINAFSNLQPYCNYVSEYGKREAITNKYVCAGPASSENDIRRRDDVFEKTKKTKKIKQTPASDMPRERTDQMIRRFHIQFTAVSNRGSENNLRQADVPTSFVVVSILSLSLLLVCRIISTVSDFFHLTDVAHFFDTAFVSSEVVLQKLNHHFNAESQGASVCTLAPSNTYGQTGTLVESSTSIALDSTADTTEGSQVLYSTSPEHSPSIKVQEESQSIDIPEEDTTTRLVKETTRSTSASDIMNDTGRWIMDQRTPSPLKNSFSSPSERITPQRLLPTLPESSPFPDPFSLTASQRAEIIDRVRRDSQSESPEQIQSVDRNHIRRRCCSPTPVRDLMGKAEKLLGEKVRPQGPTKLTTLPNNVLVLDGSRNTPGPHCWSWSEESSPNVHQRRKTSPSSSAFCRDTPGSNAAYMAGLAGHTLNVPRTRKTRSDLEESVESNPYQPLDMSSPGSFYSNVRSRPWTPENMGVAPPVSRKENLGSPTPLNRPARSRLSL